MTAEQEAFVRKAHDSLRAAKLLAAEGLVDFAAARAYYTMFYVAQALLLGQDLTLSMHGATIPAFKERLVETGAVPAHFYQYLATGHGVRRASDYAIKTNLTPDWTGTMIQQAEEFIDLADQTLGPLPPVQNPP